MKSTLLFLFVLVWRAAFFSPAAEAAEAPNAKAEKKLILTIVDETGRPVPGMEIRANTNRDNMPVLLGEFKTDDLGRVTIPLGSEPRAFLNWRGLSPQWHLHADAWHFGDPGVVVEGGVGHLTLTVYPYGTMGGIVRDAAGNPLAQAAVVAYSLHDPAEPQLRGELAATKTDAQGRWSLPKLPQRGEHLLVAFRRGSLRTLDVQPAAEGALSAPAFFAQETDVQLTAAAAIRGTVTSGGQPVAGAKISLTSRYAREGIETDTGADGQFEIRWEETGQPGMTVFAKNFALYCAPVEVSADMKPLAIALEAGRPLKGRVVDRLGHAVANAPILFAGIPGAKVCYFPASRPVVGTTDADGRFTWEHAPRRPLPSALYEVLLPDDGSELFLWDTTKNDELRVALRSR